MPDDEAVRTVTVGDARITLIRAGDLPVPADELFKDVPPALRGGGFPAGEDGQVVVPVHAVLVRVDGEAILIDTGLGIAPIRPLAEALAGVPVSVVNTHAHFDHIGGNREFSDIAIHERGAARLRQGVPEHVPPAYLAYARELIAAADLYRDLDRRPSRLFARMTSAAAMW